MAIGDANDFVGRLKAVLPPRWFPDAPGSPTSTATPVLTALLQGPAYVGAALFALIAYYRLQTRIKTATDGYLDMIAFDYFGVRFPRKAAESDTQFRRRIVLELLRPRATRPAMSQVLVDLTGRAPIIFEPARPADTGGWNQSSGLAYGSAGGWGSLQLPYQTFITAFRPLTSGIPNVSPWGGSFGGYNQPSRLEYANPSQIQGQVADSDIYAAINDVRPAASTAWVKILN